jgi:O-antigen/teichoic acid export membrane protein
VKRTRTRTTQWNIFFQYSTIFFNIITGIILVPLYLKFIPVSTYGYWLATGNIIAWLTVFDPGFATILQQRIAYHYGAKDYNKVGQFALGGVLINVLFISIIICLGFVFSYNFINWLNISDPVEIELLTESFNYALMGTILMLLSFVPISVNLGLQSSLGVGIFSFIASLTGILLTVILLYYGYNIVAIGITILFRSSIYFLGNWIYLLWRFKSENIKFKYNQNIMGEFASLSIYTFLGKTGNALSTHLNAFVSATILSPIYTTILKFTQIMPETGKLVLDRPAYALISTLTHLSGESNNELKAKYIILRFINFLIWGSGLFIIGFIIFNKPFISLWVGEQFYGGIVLNTLIVILLVITIFTQSFSYFVFALGDIKRSNVILLIKSLLFIPLLFLGAHKWGLEGIVIAGIISELFISGWYFPLSLYKLLKLNKKDIKEIAIEVCKTFIFSLFIVLFFESQSNNWFSLITQIILCILFYCVCLIFLSKQFKNEILQITVKIKIILRKKLKYND